MIDVILAPMHVPMLVPMVEFMAPRRLWWLALVALIVLLYAVLSTRTRGSNKPSHTRLNIVLPKDSAIKRHLSVVASLLAIASLVVAWAQPLGLKQVPRERATIAVAIDISLSMRAQDVAPSRIDAARVAAKDFLDMLPSGFNVSLVLFGGDVPTKTVPTTDRASVKSAIDSIKLIPATAIGDGIYGALDTIAQAPPDPKDPTKPPPAAVVLLSDGYTNVGRPSDQAARDSKAKNIPIYTIAYGTAGGYVVENGQRVPVPVNHAELARVAQLSGGKKYSAQSSSDLRSVYETLAHDLGYEQQRVEITDRYAGYALLFGILASMGVISLAARWP